jgi:hypothetical protein
MVNLPTLPSEAQKHLDIAREAARQKIEIARIHLDRKANADRELGVLGSDVPTGKRIELEHLRDWSQAQAEACVRLAARELFNAYAGQLWRRISPNAEEFARIRKAISARVREDIACPELDQTVTGTLEEKEKEWVKRTKDEYQTAAERIAFADDFHRAFIKLERNCARHPEGRVGALEGLSADLVRAALEKTLAQVNSLATYGQFEEKTRLSFGFIQAEISSLNHEDQEILLGFVRADIRQMLLDAAARMFGKPTDRSAWREEEDASTLGERDVPEEGTLVGLVHEPSDLRFTSDPPKQDEIKERQPRREPEAVRTARRTPDLKSSSERLRIVDALARELATIKQELTGFCTAEGLKQKYPHFVLWNHIEKAELKDLVDGEEFSPRAYAENLTLRKFGLTSRETLRKDRKKLRKAQRKQPDPPSN